MPDKVLVDSWVKFDTLMNDIADSAVFSYDTETNGEVDRFKASMVGISICPSNTETAYYIPFNHLEGKQLPMLKCLDDLKIPLEGDKWDKVCHNAKFDEMIMSLYDIEVGGLGHDTIIMAWLLQEQRSRGSMGLKALVETIFGKKMTTYEEVVESNTKRGQTKDYNFAKVPLDQALDYAADDAYYCWQLFKHFKKELEKQKLWDAYRYIEAPFSRILGNMESVGIKVDSDAIAYADKRFPEILNQVESEIFEEAGEVFEVQSRAQLGRIIFEKKGIGKNVPRTKSGDYKTDKKTLEMYATKHKIVENVLRRKKIKKTHSTFVEGTKKFVARDGRIHPRFNGNGTVTGRLSGSNPNMQQIEADEVEEIKVRDFFIPSEYNKFIVADYSQIELRVMAHFSKDKYMIESFQSGRDFHDEVAKRMFDVPDGEEPSRRQRVVAKTLNFGVGYGRGPNGIAEQLEISQKEAQEFIANWFGKFAGVEAYKKYLISRARKEGFIRTLSGRKRRLLPDIRSDDWLVRGRAERQAFNTKIQGSAADIIKMAMISMDSLLEDIGAQMVIQIHDEIVIDCPEEVAEDALVTVKDIMENPFKGKNPLILPILTEPKIVDRWGDAK